MTTEMVKLRQMLDEEGIEWKDCSDPAEKLYHIDRTHFWNRKFHWSVIHGYGTYGAYPEDQGLLELMSDAVNEGNPIGYLTAEQCMKYVKGEWNGNRENPGMGQGIDNGANRETVGYSPNDTH